MMYRDKNFTVTLPAFADGDEFISCNFSRPVLGDLAAGVSGLRFDGCNLTNCRLPADAVTVDCNTAKIDFCYWLHPEMALPVEVDNCRHVTNSDTVSVDGQAVYTEYYREDKDAV